MQKKHLRTRRRLMHLVRTGFWASESGVHSRRVAVKLALCSRDLHIQAHLLREAGLLHDVGKSLLKQSVLYKPGRPTEEEKAHIDKHTFLGFQLLEGASPMAKEAALQHHSVRKGGDLWLQVLHLIDIEDACGNTRCYRTAMQEEQLREVLTAEGSEMDQAAVDIFWTHYSEFRKLDS